MTGIYAHLATTVAVAAMDYFFQREEYQRDLELARQRELAYQQTTAKGKSEAMAWIEQDFQQRQQSQGTSSPSAPGEPFNEQREREREYASGMQEFQQMQSQLSSMTPAQRDSGQGRILILQMGALDKRLQKLKKELGK